MSKEKKKRIWMPKKRSEKFRDRRERRNRTRSEKNKKAIDNQDK